MVDSAVVSFYVTWVASSNFIAVSLVIHYFLQFKK
jgi:hypothetical protein